MTLTPADRPGSERRVRAERAIMGLALLALVAAYGCGGGSSSSGGGGSATPTPGGATPTPGGGGGMGGGIMWPLRGGGTTKQVPPSVQIGRVVFESQSGESCCTAVNPPVLSGGPSKGLAILTNLPPGP